MMEEKSLIDQENNDKDDGDNQGEKVFSRHANQIAVGGFGLAGQEKLWQARILVMGSGPVALALCRSMEECGIGAIKIVDSHLAALNSLRSALNFAHSSSRISYQLIESMADFDLESLVSESGLVVDLLDDWQEKLNLSDICMSSRRALLHCAGSGMRFQLFSMVPGQSCCLRCLLASLGLEDAIGGQSEKAILTLLPV